MSHGSYDRDESRHEHESEANIDELFAVGVGETLPVEERKQVVVTGDEPRTFTDSIQATRDARRADAHAQVQEVFDEANDISAPAIQAAVRLLVCPSDAKVLLEREQGRRVAARDSAARHALEPRPEPRQESPLLRGSSPAGGVDAETAAYIRRKGLAKKLR